MEFELSPFIHIKYDNNSGWKNNRQDIYKDRV